MALAPRGRPTPGRRRPTVDAVLPHDPPWRPGARCAPTSTTSASISTSPRWPPSMASPSPCGRTCPAARPVAVGRRARHGVRGRPTRSSSSSGRRRGRRLDRPGAAPCRAAPPARAHPRRRCRTEPIALAPGRDPPHRLLGRRPARPPEATSDGTRSWREPAERVIPVDARQDEPASGPPTRAPSCRRLRRTDCRPARRARADRAARLLTDRDATSRPTAGDRRPGWPEAATRHCREGARGPAATRPHPAHRYTLPPTPAV